MFMSGIAFISLLYSINPGYIDEDELVTILDSAIEKSAKCAEFFHEYDSLGAIDCYEALYSSATHDLVKSMARQGTAQNYQRLGEYRRALNDMQEAIRLAHPHEEAVLYMARLLSVYSDLLVFHEQYELADRYLDSAREYYETYIQVMESDHPKTGFLVYEVTAELYLETERLSEAKSYAQKAIDKANAIPEMTPSTTYLLLAKIENSESNAERAIFHAWNACESDGNHPAVVEGCILSAQLFKTNGNERCMLQAVSRAQEKIASAPWEDSDLSLEIDLLAKVNTD